MKNTSILKLFKNNLNHQISFVEIIIFMILVFWDQYTKLFLIEHLPFVDYKMEITSFLDLRYAWNYGISFGLFDHQKEYGNLFFGIFNSFVVIYILYLFSVSRTNLEKYGYLIIIAGAIGNLIDRIVHGAVFDFILLHYHHWQFSIFNLADSFVSFGVFLLVINHFLTFTKSSID